MEQNFTLKGKDEPKMKPHPWTWNLKSFERKIIFKHLQTIKIPKFPGSLQTWSTPKFWCPKLKLCLISSSVKCGNTAGPQVHCCMAQGATQRLWGVFFCNHRQFAVEIPSVFNRYGFSIYPSLVYRRVYWYTWGTWSILKACLTISLRFGRLQLCSHLMRHMTHIYIYMYILL